MIDSARRELILISSITGQDIRGCADMICQHSHGRGYYARTGNGGVLCVEDKLIEVASPVVLRCDPSKRNVGLTDALCLPYGELVLACRGAFENALKEVSTEAEKMPGNDIGFLPFHPVLYHQRTHEFVVAYDGGILSELLSRHGFEVSFVVSIHEDVYDIYKRLLDDTRLFNPSSRRVPKDGKRWREPIQDIVEQRLILEWRDRELSTAKTIAASLRARHFLFHQKGRPDSLWKIVGKKESAVYFSHPISQSRRDINNIKQPGKCENPDPARGEQFIKECVAFADKLATVAPLVEPTAIDELRIDYKWLDFEAETVAELKTGFLPPLTRRWPLGNSVHLGGAYPDLGVLPLTPAPARAYSYTIPSESTQLKELIAAVQVFEFELRRQIAVRDHTLAEQCDVVVAYRPYTLPDSPHPSGGVEKEMRDVLRKVALDGAGCKPSLIVYHTESDERKRRELEFDVEWDKTVNQFFDSVDAGKKAEFRRKARELIINAPYVANVAEVTKSLLDLIQELAIQATPSGDSSSMPADPYSRATDRKTEFATELLERTAILASAIQTEAENDRLKEHIRITSNNSDSTTGVLFFVKNTVNAGT